MENGKETSGAQSFQQRAAWLLRQIWKAATQRASALTSSRAARTSNHKAQTATPAGSSADPGVLTAICGDTESFSELGPRQRVRHESQTCRSAGRGGRREPPRRPPRAGAHCVRPAARRGGTRRRRAALTAANGRALSARPFLPPGRARAGPRRGGGAPVPAGSPEGRQGEEERRVSAPEPRLPPPRHLAPNFPSQPTWGRGSRRLLPLSAAGRPAAARTTPSPAAAAPSSRLLTPPSGPLPPPSALLLRAVCRARPRALTQRRGSGGRAPAPLGACGGERGRGARPALPCRSAPHRAAPRRPRGAAGAARARAGLRRPRLVRASPGSRGGGRCEAEAKGRNANGSGIAARPPSGRAT